MNLYLVERTDGVGLDEYDSFVAIAPTDKAAREMNLGGDHWPKPSTLKVKLIGRALRGAKAGIVHSSFNAG